MVLPSTQSNLLVPESYFAVEIVTFFFMLCFVRLLLCLVCCLLLCSFVHRLHLSVFVTVCI